MSRMNAVSIGYNKFCGPAVLSILTGKSTDECAAVISSITGNYKVTGIELPHLMKAAEKLGFSNERISMAEGGSIFGSMPFLINKPGMYIITVPKHYVAIEITEDKKAFFCDNHTKEPIKLESSARLQQRVEACNRVFEKPIPVQLSEEIILDTYDTTFYVYRHIKFSDGESKRISLGSIRFANQIELADIIHRINKRYNFK